MPQMPQKRNKDYTPTPAEALQLLQSGAGYCVLAGMRVRASRHNGALVIIIDHATINDAGKWIVARENATIAEGSK